VFLLADCDRPERLRHSELGHHPASDARGSLDVVPRAGRNLRRPEHEILGHPTAEQHDELPLQPPLRVIVPVFLGKRRGESEGLPPRYDRDFVQWVEPGNPPGDHGMSSLVVGRHPPLLVRDHHAPALGPKHDLVLGVLEVHHLHPVLLVDDVRQVRAGETRSPLGEHLQVDVVRKRNLFRVHPEDAFSAVDVRDVNNDLAIEAPGSQQCRVQHVGSVGRGQKDDPFVGLEAIHLHQELIQRLLPLVVSAAQAGAPVPAYRIDLVDEDDARGV